MRVLFVVDPLAGLDASIDTSVGCAGGWLAPGSIRSAPTSVGAGSFSVSVGGALNWTTRCGAVQDVRGSPSVAA